MNITKSEIYIFKLNSGHEVIARVEEIRDDHYVVSEPITAVLNEQGLSFMPSFFASDPKKSHRLNINSCSMVATPRDDVADSYLQAITGVELPPKKRLITG